MDHVIHITPTQNKTNTICRKFWGYKLHLKLFCLRQGQNERKKERKEGEKGKQKAHYMHFLCPCA